LEFRPSGNANQHYLCVKILKNQAKESLIFNLATVYNFLCQQQTAVAESDQDVKNACLDEKKAMLDPSLTKTDYQNELGYHNTNCANLTRALK
jgi:hypothetical protein